MRTLPTMLTLVLSAAAISISLWSAQSGWSRADDAVTEADPDESVDVRLARAHLELARLDLRSAREANERIADLFPAGHIDRLRLHVATDEAQLEQALTGEAADPHQICIRSAEAAVEMAEADLQRLRAAHERMPTAVRESSVERAAVVAEIARLNLERARHLDADELLLTHLQWQIDDLRHQVLELQMTAHGHR